MVQPIERRREVCDPFDREAVGTQRVVLGAQGLGFVSVDRQAEAADAPERVARQHLHPIE